MWMKDLERRWRYRHPIPLEKQGRALAQGVALLAARPVRHALALPEQPLDAHLLKASRLFARSRKLYGEAGGKFRSTLVSSPRTLGSAVLLEPLIEYSPLQSEYLWGATDPRESRTGEHLLELRQYATSTYHEQNHRVLWKLLPPPPRDSEGVRRYLNFAEALVITLDMALGDELGRLAPLFYLAGVTYDPGTSIGERGLSRRDYRNYLHAALYATYLNLELYNDERIPKLVVQLYPYPLSGRAAQRAGRLDAQFIALTNLDWQKKHAKTVARALRRPGVEPLELGDDPADNRLAYLWGERVFERWGL